MLMAVEYITTAMTKLIGKVVLVSSAFIKVQLILFIFQLVYIVYFFIILVSCAYMTFLVPLFFLVSMNWLSCCFCFFLICCLFLALKQTYRMSTFHLVKFTLALLLSC